MAENQAWQGISCLEDLSAELLMTIFDYLSSIEILATFFNLNERVRRTICDYLQTGNRLIHFNFNHTDFVTYQLFCRDILPQFQSTMTSFQLGSDYHFGQIDSFTHYSLCRLDSLTLRLTDPTALIETLQKFLSFNRLRWFDRIHLILNEESVGWNDQLPFCVQSIPVRHLSIKGQSSHRLFRQLPCLASRSSSLCLRSTQSDRLLHHHSFDHRSQIRSW